MNIETEVNLEEKPMPTTTVDGVSIVIVNWNSREYVRNCLNSIQNTKDKLNLQIIIVDGASFDGCREMVEEEFPYVEFIQLEENVGFGRCNNAALDRIRYEYLLLLNPDTELKDNSLQLLLQAIDKLPNVGIIGARLLNSDGTLQTSSVQAAPTPLNQSLGSNFLMKLLPKSNLWKSASAYSSSTPSKVDAVSGACMLLKTTVFKKLEGFRPSYFMYSEDMDLCLRVKQLGRIIYHVPRAEIVHHGGGSSSVQASQFSTIKKCEAMNLYMVLNHGSFTANRYRLFMLLSAIGRIAVLSLQFWRSDTMKNASIAKWNTILNWSLGSHEAKEVVI